MKFLDLRGQHKEIEAEMEAAVLAILRSGSYVLGEPVERFEDAFSRYCGAGHAIGVSSGTAALHLALVAAGIGPGDEVITVPTTFVATVAAIIYAGARPVFVDVDPVTWNMDPSLIAPAVTPRTKAVLPVHFHGRLADMDAISTVAREYGLMVIEDAAQAHGASRGKSAGTFGAMGCFSFYPGKNLGAAGEGGAVVTDDPALAERLRCLRDWGQASRYNHVMHGFNYRMDTIQGAVLGVKLKSLNGWNGVRRHVANTYDAGLALEIARAKGPFGADHACHIYAINVPDRDALKAKLADAGIPTGLHYPTPVHLQPAYSDLGYRAGDFPVTEHLAKTTLSLPIHPVMTDGEIEQVVATLNLNATTSSVNAA